MERPLIRPPDETPIEPARWKNGHRAFFCRHRAIGPIWARWARGTQTGLIHAKEPRTLNLLHEEACGHQEHILTKLLTCPKVSGTSFLFTKRLRPPGKPHQAHNMSRVACCSNTKKCLQSPGGPYQACDMSENLSNVFVAERKELAAACKTSPCL